MPAKPSFSREIVNLLYNAETNPVQSCIQCGTCSSTCPAVEFMDHSPRNIIALIRADLRGPVLSSNAFWCCASCYQCTVRCPAGIDIAGMMYGLKRYSMWRNHFKRGSIGADFSRRFARMILKNGKSFEPALATPYLFHYGLRAFLYDARNALALFMKGRLPLFPKKLKRSARFKRILNRIIPMGRAA